MWQPLWLLDARLAAFTLRLNLLPLHEYLTLCLLSDPLVVDLNLPLSLLHVLSAFGVCCHLSDLDLDLLLLQMLQLRPRLLCTLHASCWEPLLLKLTLRAVSREPWRVCLAMYMYVRSSPSIAAEAC
jgi:hypothetical protein